MPPLIDTDLLLVQRGSECFSLTWAQLKQEIQALPFNTPQEEQPSTEPQE